LFLGGSITKKKERYSSSKHFEPKTQKEDNNY